MLFPSVNKQKKWLLLLLVLVVSANVYFHFTFVGTLENRAQWIDSLFARTFHPAQRFIQWTQNATSSGVGVVVRLWSADQENQSLKSQLAEQELRLQKLTEIEKENDQLRALMEFKKQSSLSLLSAHVIGRDVSLYFRTLEIDRGAEDGVTHGMTVVAPAGAVGRIIKVYNASSTVLLITDINSRMDAMVQRSRTRVIVGGSVEGDLTLRFLPRRHDLRQGDELVTSGFGGFFPQGFRVGVVVGLAQDPHFVLEQAELEPAVDFDSLENVFVVRTLARWP